MIKHFKYIALSFLAIGFMACENDTLEDLRERANPLEKELPLLDKGSLNLSNYVAVGASFTAGFTDGGLFIASQENSFPNILSQQFAKVGGGEFKQPLMNDNTGGILVNGTIKRGYRLVFNGSGPAPVNLVLAALGNPIPDITTDAINNKGSDFNNFGIPGAKSWHLLAPGYAGANPFYARISSTPGATVLADAMAQNPTFFTLSEVGGNDVLGYALSGGESDTTSPNYDPITPVVGAPGIGFNESFKTLVNTLTSNGAKGVVTNVPYVKDLPHFTTIPFKPLSPANPAFGPQIPTLNGIFGQLNQVFAFLGVPERSIVFSQTEASAVVIKDESLPNLSAQITGVLNGSPTFPTFVQSFGLPAAAAPSVANLFGVIYGQARQSNENDLLVLPSRSVIGTVNANSVAFLESQQLPEQLANQFSAEGITLPLADKWVLLPSEQNEITMATDAYNMTINDTADSNDDIAIVDLNAILTELATTGINFDEFNLNANLVTGGAVSLDGFHLTARGYAFMANKFLEAIDTKFGSNFITSGNVANANNYPTNYPAVFSTPQP